jgi:hypothetical protein
VITVKITAPVRPMPVAMLVDDAVVDPGALCPDPSREKWREGEERAQAPLSVSPLPARRRPPCLRQHRPTARRSQDRNSPARPRDRRARRGLCTLPGPPHR